QPGVGEVGRTGLRKIDVTLDHAADLAPDVDVPARRRFQCHPGSRKASPRVACDRARMRSRRVIENVYRRKQSGAGLLHQGHRLTVGSLGSGQGLVGDVDLPFEGIQGWVMVDRPPSTAIEMVPWRGQLPALKLLVG